MKTDIFNHYIAPLVDFNTQYDWLFEIAVILALTTFFSLLAGLILRGISRMMSRTLREWDDLFVEAARTPLKCTIWVIGIYIAVNIGLSEEKRPPIWFERLGDARDLAIVMMVAWALNRFVLASERHFIETRKRRKRAIDLTATTAISRFSRIAINICALLVCLQQLGIGIDGVLAFGGISGIAVGFAAKDMLANFFGALIIYYDKPFKVGDWIRSPDQEIEGTVEHIGWRMTTIRTLERRPLYVPNSVFTTISVENPSRMSHRRIKMHVGVRYKDLRMIKMIGDEVRAMIHEHTLIDQELPVVVRFDQFGEFSCDILVVCFTQSVDVMEFHEVKEDILLNIATIIHQHGADIPFPTQTQHYDGDEEAALHIAKSNTLS